MSLKTLLEIGNKAYAYLLKAGVWRSIKLRLCLLQAEEMCSDSEISNILLNIKIFINIYIVRPILMWLGQHCFIAALWYQEDDGNEPRTVAESVSESIEWAIESQVFLQSYDSATRSTPSPHPPSVSKLSLFLCLSVCPLLSYLRERGREW